MVPAVFENSFEVEHRIRMLIVAGVTVLYTFFGGFIGASYTDMMQGLLMMAALLMVPALGIFEVGGPAQMLETVTAINPNAFSLIAGTTAVGVASSLGWGLGYFGQPHIIVRFMALRSAADAKAGRRIGIGWMVLSMAGAVFTGLIGLAYFAQHPELTLDNPEAVFLAMAQIRFHPLVAGFVLAAVLAASCDGLFAADRLSSALWRPREDGAKRRSAPSADLAGTHRRTRGCAPSRCRGHGRAACLALVAFAWAASVPLRSGGALTLFWRRLTASGAMLGMVAGAVVVPWQYTPWVSCTRSSSHE